MAFKQEFQIQIIADFSKLYEEEEFDSFKNIQKLIKNYEHKYKEAYEGDAWGQSWRVWKGNIFEELIFKLIELYIKDSNISLANEKNLGVNCTGIMKSLREHVLIKYEEGEIIPDSDIVIYNKNNLKVLAIISCKTSFRDRISMVGYWALKVKDKPFKYVFVTLDEDNHFSNISSTRRKARLILEDTNGGFVLNENIEEDNYIKYFSHFQQFLDQLIKAN